MSVLASVSVYLIADILVIGILVNLFIGAPLLVSVSHAIKEMIKTV